MTGLRTSSGLLAFKLDGIERIRIVQGGYKLTGFHISDYSKLPAPRTWLSLGPSVVDPAMWNRRPYSYVSLNRPGLLKGGSFNCCLSMSELAELIRCIRANNWWSTDAAGDLMARIIVGSGSNWAAAPHPVVIEPPVAPVNQIDYMLATDSELRYPPKAGDGHVLFNTNVKSDFDGRYLFCSGGVLTVDPDYRGFDCSSFLRTAMGILSDVDIAKKASSDHVSFGGEIAELCGFF